LHYQNAVVEKTTAGKSEQVGAGGQSHGLLYDGRV